MVNEARPPLILTLDVGTSSVRAMLFDATASPVEGMEAQHAHQMENTADGGVQTDADALFERLAGCIDELLRQAGRQAERIGAVATTTFWHNVLGVSANGAALTPVLTWADTRAAVAAAALRAELDAGAVHARTGCVPHPSYLPAKLRWLLGPAAHEHRKTTTAPGDGAPPRNIHPASGERRGDHSLWPTPADRHALQRARYWLSFAELMTLRLFGSPSCSISMASGSGLLDQRRLRWDEEMLAAIPLDMAHLSPLDDTPRRGLRPAYAKRWPALARTPWFPGWGDGATSNVGCGCVTRRQVAIMVGTSGAMRVVTDLHGAPPRIPPKLWCYRVDAERAVLGGALSNGGNLIEWLRATLRLPDDLNALEAALAAQEPDAHGLTFLPFLAGERSTGWHADARGTLSGMRLHTTPLDIMRAGHEAVAYRFGLVHTLIRQALTGGRTPWAPVTASGAALLHSPAWMQMMADVLGHPVTASTVAEGSSRGAALLALETIGAIKSIADVAAPLGATYHPDRRRGAIYAEAAARQQSLYAELIEGERPVSLP